MIKEEKRGFGLAGDETKLMQMINESSIPRTRGLLKTIHRLLKLPHILRIARVLKTRWLLHINIFLQKTMKKGITNFNLTETPSARDNKRDH
jgi:hypothetical protein